MRKLTMRERVLLVILGFLAVICAYVFLFYLPSEERLTGLEGRIAQSQMILEQSQAMVQRQQQMEQELEDLSASGNAPREMPAYDNLQAVMVELNSILADSQEYTLRFASADGEETVAERRVTLPFTCADYDTAKGILRRLHDSDLRCQLEDVSLSQGENGAVQVTASLIFYEYREK